MNEEERLKRNKESHKKYSISDKGKETQRRYRQSKKGKETIRLKEIKYRQTKKYKEFKRKYNSEYSKTIKNKLYRSKYKQTKKYKDYQKKYSKTSAYKKSRKKYEQSPFGKYKACSYEQARRERLNNSIRSFTDEQWKAKCKLTNGVCPACNEYFDDKIHKLTLDHILSLYWANEYFKQTGKKFIYTIDLVAPLCLSCNCKKHKELVLEVKPKGLNINMVIN